MTTNFEFQYQGFYHISYPQTCQEPTAKEIFEFALCTLKYRPYCLAKSPYIFCDFQKICYDKAGNLPNKGRNFNTQTWGKIVYFLFVWLVGIGFRQNFFHVLNNFGDFGAKMSFFHYIINQKRNNFIKHCFPPPPVYQEAADIRDVYLYKKFAVQVVSWYKGGTMFYRQKTKRVSA